MSFLDFPIYSLPQDQILNPTTLGQEGGCEVAVYVQESQYGSEEQDLLAKIIGATGRALSNVKIAQMRDSEIIPLHRTWDQDHEGLDIVFGINKKQLMLQCQDVMYFPIHINKRTILFSDSLTSLKGDSNKKKQLWMGLKTHFAL